MQNENENEVTYDSLLPQLETHITSQEHVVLEME
jgi:hypothetical protein